jgi:hypothetical protein
MSLSLESIHKPLNDFFLTRFGTGPDSPVCFRFDKFGSELSDGDFIDHNLPAPGYSPALALERWSDLVNRIPADDSDGMNIVFTTNAIDLAYGIRLLKPAEPFFLPSADEETKNRVIGAFSLLKDFALKRWQQLSLESSSGLMLTFSPSPPMPIDWYDKSNAGNWTGQSFHITEPATPAPPTDAGSRLWRMKIDDATLTKVLDATEPAPSPGHVLLRAHLIESASPTVRPLMAVRAVAPVGVVAQPVAPARAGMRAAAMTPMRHLGVDAPVAAKTFQLQDSLRQRVTSVDISKRLLINQVLVPQAPTQPVTTPSISISFEYCVIRVSRPWFIDAFINDTSWCVPTLAKGEMTASDKFGATLPLLPIAAVAIRNLSISGNWTAQDVANAATATDFGPFKVDAAIVNNSLSHAGIQIAGWLLQRMPPLPPNAAVS